MRLLWEYLMIKLNLSIKDGYMFKKILLVCLLGIQIQQINFLVCMPGVVENAFIDGVTDILNHTFPK